eukprot:2428515-Rhodomonas_salina.2
MAEIQVKSVMGVLSWDEGSLGCHRQHPQTARPELVEEWSGRNPRRDFDQARSIGTSVSSVPCPKP